MDLSLVIHVYYMCTLKTSMNFYEMVSSDSDNCFDREMSLGNRNIKRFPVVISSMELANHPILYLIEQKW